MSASLSRRSGFRLSKRVNPNALPRPTQRTAFDTNDDYASTTDPSDGSYSLESERQHPEVKAHPAAPERDVERANMRMIGEDDENIHTRLLNDPFSREYTPSFPLATAPAGGSGLAYNGSNIEGTKSLTSPALIDRMRPNSSHNPRATTATTAQSRQHQEQPTEFHLPRDLQFPEPPTFQHRQYQHQQHQQQQQQQEEEDERIRWSGNAHRQSSQDPITPWRASLNGLNSPMHASEISHALDEDVIGSIPSAVAVHYESESQSEEYETSYSDSDDDSLENGISDPRGPLRQDAGVYWEQDHWHDPTSASSPSSPAAPVLPRVPPPIPQIIEEYGHGHGGIPVRVRSVKYSAKMETKETLRRERTRILRRTVVSTYRQIDWDDISNIRPLKKGGFGEIHTGEWSHLQIVLKRALIDEDKGVEQFDQELEILKRVHDYDYIVPFYGVTIDPQTKVRCMVMKHCSNGNLVSFIEKNHDTLSWPERYRLSIEITKGLEFLHKSGFHHRDLHSGNILLDDKRTAMICDFGLSRSSNKEKTSDLVAVVGVASFLAPERFPRPRPVYSAACDIYSLGVIFWHISSGRIPFLTRLHDPTLLGQLVRGFREDIVPGTPTEFRDLLVKCWDVNPSKRPKIDVVIAILQTLIANPTEPVFQLPMGFMVPSDATSGALPMPPELETKMASLERASNTLNLMVFDIKDPSMRETVAYIEHARAYHRKQPTPPEPYSPSNPSRTPIYLCPLIGDIAALNYYLTYHRPYNPINESSEQTGDTALHLACLFLESPLDTIKVLVELGADINLENLQGYTPVMILLTSNTQYCYEALKYLIARGARIPAYVRRPVTPLNNAQVYAMNLVNESRQVYLSGVDASKRRRQLWNRRSSGNDNNHNNNDNNNVRQDRGNQRASGLLSQGRPLMHIVAAMQEDYRILDCLCEAGLDPAISYGGETALVAAAAHLRIKNVEWLLNNDLDISTKASVQRAIHVVRKLHSSVLSSTGDINPIDGQNGKNTRSNNSNSNGGNDGRLDPRVFPDDIRELGKYSWAGVAYKDTNWLSKDMVIPVLQLLEQWTGPHRMEARKEVAIKLQLIHGGPAVRQETYPSPPNSGSRRPLSPGVPFVATPPLRPPRPPSPSQPHHRSHSPSRLGANRQLSLRKTQRHLIDQVLYAQQESRFR
ncbi:hypothetical protein BGZ98_010315 [Dissophora globulifera]|nr:hypothetical protein BGZ98_010315 [Dissophora globulifera]